jgi:hypothetical protein
MLDRLIRCVYLSFFFAAKISARLTKDQTLEDLHCNVELLPSQARLVLRDFSEYRQEIFNPSPCQRNVMEPAALTRRPKSFQGRILRIWNRQEVVRLMLLALAADANKKTLACRNDVAFAEGLGRS